MSLTDGSNGSADNLAFPSLANIETFAVAHGKPMSFSEWGLLDGDDGIAQLGSSIPRATAAYSKAFK